MSCGSRSTSTSPNPASLSISLAFSSPHIVPRPTLRQRDRHAVHRGDGVHERPERVVEVVVEVAGACYVLHQVDAVVSQGGGYPFEHLSGLGLVVDSVEAGDKVVAGLFVEGGHILDLKADVGVPCSWAAARARAMASSEKS